MATTKVRAEGRGNSTDLTDRLLDVNEAADMLALKPATLYQWAYQRRIPVVKLFGPRGALRFREGDIRALITKSVRPALGYAAILRECCVRLLPSRFTRDLLAPRDDDSCVDGQPALRGGPTGRT